MDGQICFLKGRYWLGIGLMATAMDINVCIYTKYIYRLKEILTEGLPRDYPTKVRRVGVGAEFLFFRCPCRVGYRGILFSSKNFNFANMRFSVIFVALMALLFLSQASFGKTITVINLESFLSPHPSRNPTKSIHCILSYVLPGFERILTSKFLSNDKPGPSYPEFYLFLFLSQPRNPARRSA